MKYYGDAEITGKATVDGEVESKGKLTADNGVSITHNYQHNNLTDKYTIKTLNNSGPVLTSERYFKSNTGLRTAININVSNILLLAANTEQDSNNTNEYNDTKTSKLAIYSDRIISIADTIELQGDNINFYNRDGDTKFYYINTENKLLTNTVFEAKNYGSINATKVKISNNNSSSYYSMSYSNGILTFTS